MFHLCNPHTVANCSTQIHTDRYTYGARSACRCTSRFIVQARALATRATPSSMVITQAHPNSQPGTPLSSNVANTCDALDWLRACCDRLTMHRIQVSTSGFTCHVYDNNGNNQRAYHLQNSLPSVLPPLLQTS
eukprot:m.1631811 g.1631811  ORF g.1631811 m.1631811 type:complete len:133 (-) comp25403_c0_seq39:3572-3970(-)